MLSRRSALKHFLFFSAGTILLPSCLQEKSKTSLSLKNISIQSDQEQTLAEMGENFIPKTDAPGSKDLSLHLFALTMVDDCYSKEEQQKFIRGLAAMNAYCRNTFGKDFQKGDPAEKNAVYAVLEQRKPADPDLLFFYHSLKHLIIEGYTTSQFYLTRIHFYKLVPGPYQGCVPVNSVSA